MVVMAAIMPSRLAAAPEHISQAAASTGAGCRRCWGAGAYRDIAPGAAGCGHGGAAAGGGQDTGWAGPGADAAVAGRCAAMLAVAMAWYPSSTMPDGARAGPGCPC